METQFEPSQTSNETPDNAQQGNAEGTTKKAHVRASLAERQAALEKRREKLNQQAAALKKEARRERNGQLIAWGIMTELIYKDKNPQRRNSLREAAKKYLKERELNRALAGFDRLDAGESQNEKV